MKFIDSYLIGKNSVPISVQAGWETFDGGKWEFCCLITVVADGRSDDSIRWSDVSATD